MDPVGLAIAIFGGALSAFLAGTGFDPVYGARPLRRVIQKKVQDVLAVEILSGKFKEGDAVVGDVRDGELVFKKNSV